MSMPRTCAIAVALLVALAASAQAQAKPRMLFGHRGNSQEHPENTIPAFLSCVELGCEAHEMDLYLTRDDVVVVIHDSTVDRTTNGTGRVGDYTLAQLKALDAGYRYTPDNGRTYPYRGKGITVPTLAEVIEQVPAGLFNVDMKDSNPAMPELLARVIEQYNAQDRFIVGSFDDQTVAEFRAIAPGVTTLAGVAEIARFTLLFYDGRADEHKPEASYYEVPTGYVRDVAAYIAAANSLTPPVKMVFWTINNEGEMRELLDAGADGIITDNVRGAAAIFAEYDQ